MNDTTTIDTAADSVNTSVQEGKTFSQEDVNRIVSERLGKEKSRTDAELAKKEQELAHKELLFTLTQKLSAQGLPADLLVAINTSSSEAADKSLDIISKVITLKTEAAIQSAGAANPHRKLDLPPPGQMPGTDNNALMRAAMGLK